MDAESVAEIGKAHQQKKKGASCAPLRRLWLGSLTFYLVAAINNQHLQNAVIQMRKAANHPLLFHADIDSILPADVHAELRSSGKMLLLERLLVPLLKKRHKVLIFSQFVTMLDIVCVQLSLSSRQALTLDAGTSGATRSRAGRFALSRAMSIWTRGDNRSRRSTTPVTTVRTFNLAAAQR